MAIRKDIDIRMQPRMGFVRTFVMTLHGIRYRLFRSAVTVMVIAVAVAFLMNVACESVVTARVRSVTRDQIADAQMLAQWVSRLTIVPSTEEILRRLASGDAAFATEVLQMPVDLDETDVERLSVLAQQAVVYLDFFAKLDYGRTRRLVHRAIGPGIFDRLQDPSLQDAFRQNVVEMREIRLPGEAEAWEVFLAVWPEVQEAVGQIQAGREQAVTAIGRAVGGRPLLEHLTNAQGAFGDEVRRAGFVLPDAVAADLAARAVLERDARQIADALTEPSIRSVTAAYLDVLPADLDVATLWRLLDDAGRATWFRERAVAAGHAAAGFDASYLVAVAHQQRRQRRLLHAERLIGPETASGGVAGMEERIAWLLLASVVVCIVGIANAMLMAVTERFREIATLKCLGALDGTIMNMFVQEATLFGVAGGLAGTVLGTLIGMGRMAVRFRDLLVGAIPWGDLLSAMGASLLLGIVLAAFASVYPSLKAARLAPMEAMRIE